MRVVVNERSMAITTADGTTTTVQAEKNADGSTSATRADGSRITVKADGMSVSITRVTARSSKNQSAAKEDDDGGGLPSLLLLPKAHRHGEF